MAVRDTPSRLEIAVGGDPVLVGAGNIASCSSSGDEITAALLDGVPGTVFTAGDNVYENGTSDEFLDCYGPSWGRHRPRTRPVPGDYEYRTSGAAPYFAYFDTLAGPNGRGYYSYDLGSWHLIALDSNIPSSPSSAQYRWLKADLKAHPTACSIAFWHHPRFSSGIHGDHKSMRAIWKVLDDAGVDVAVSAHDHIYERFAPQNADGLANSNGVREFIVGTGGESLGSFGVIRPNSEVRYNGSVGVLKLTLNPRSYSWEFVPDPAATFTDTGTATCVQMPGNAPPVASAGGPYAGVEGGTGIVFDGSGSSDPENEVLTHAWDFGDGATGPGVTARHAYADNGSYTVTLVVTDPGGLTDTTATTAMIANVAPMATFDAPATVPVDSAYGLSLNDPADVSSTDFLAGFSYAFDCGSGYGEWSAVSSTTCAGVSVAGPRTVKGQIRDKDVGVSEYSETIEIEAPDTDTNDPPVASAGGPYTGDEGGTGIVFEGSGSSDPENEVLTYAWDFGDGATGQGVTERHAYADNGSYTVTLVVTDPGGLTDTTATTAMIANVAPMATFDAPVTVPVDSAYSLSLNDPADVSSTDFLAGFSYAFDCGSGYGEWSAVSSTTCAGVSVAGPRTVKGQIRDKDVGVSEYPETIEVETAVPPPPAADSFPVPIMDGAGLYGGGSNTPPAFHADAGLASATQVPDSGAVLVSLGMSLTRIAFEEWKRIAVTDAVMVNGACGGCVVSAWTGLARIGWQNAFAKLDSAGLAPSDVDVVWMSVTKEQNIAAATTDLETILAVIRQAYPNVKQVFVSNRTYGGYRTKGSAEPMAWEDGVAVKQFVLHHLGEMNPWVGWAGDLWANGATPRSDGLQWFRADFKDDGLHYSPVVGTQKVGALARDQFEASPFTGWYQR